MRMRRPYLLTRLFSQGNDCDVTFYYLRHNMQGQFSWKLNKSPNRQIAKQSTSQMRNLLGMIRE